MTGNWELGWRRATGALLLTAMVALALSACGSSSGGSSTVGAGSNKKSSGAAEGLERAEAVVARLKKQPTTVGKIKPLPKIDKQSQITFIKCGLPVCAVHAEGFEEATKALGIAHKVLNGGNTPQEQTKAFDEAVSEAPAAVVELGFNLELFETQLAELKAKGIPVLSGGDTIGGNYYNGAIVTDVQPPSSFIEVGEHYADFAIAESEGKGNIVFVNAPEVPLLTVLKEGFEKAMKANCPECTVAVENIKLEDIGRAIPSQMVSYLQAHPETEWMVFSFGDAIAGVPQALKAAGIEGEKITSGAGSKLNWGYIEEGAQTMDVAANPKIEAFWLVDRAVRSIAGEKYGPTPLPEPSQYVTKQTIEEFKPEFDLEGEGWTVPGFQEEFVKSWGWK